MTKLKLSNKLPDCEIKHLTKTRHKISKKDIEEYYNKEEDEIND